MLLWVGRVILGLAAAGSLFVLVYEVRMRAFNGPRNPTMIEQMILLTVLNAVGVGLVWAWWAGLLVLVAYPAAMIFMTALFVAPLRIIARLGK